MGMAIEELEPLEDSRHGNAELHFLHDILVIAPSTVLCVGETCTDMTFFDDRQNHLRIVAGRPMSWSLRPGYRGPIGAELLRRSFDWDYYYVDGIR